LVEGDERLIFNDRKGMQGKSQIFIKSGAVAYINEYYPFGLVNQQTSSTQYGSKEQRYKYNGKELMKDFGLESNDYGARLYNPQLGRWFVPDKKAEANPDWTPYRAFYNNPMKYVDPDGNIELPASMAKSHPNFYAYMKNNYANDVMSNQRITTAMNRWSGGNLTDKEISKAVTFGSGPKLKAALNPGGLIGSNGNYDPTNKTIELSKKRLDYLEKVLSSSSSNEDKLRALFAVYMTLNHEVTHYGDWLDGVKYFDPKTGEYIEVGEKFEDEVWRGTNIPDENGTPSWIPYMQYDKYNGEDMDDVMDRKGKEIDDTRKEEIRKSLNFPTLPN
jgi:RHS repeat-associated protein